MATQDRGATVIVDLRGVTFLDSTGIGEPVAAHQRARREGRRLVVVRSEQTQIAQVLGVTVTEARLETADSPRAAGFGEPEGPARS
jgi:anti-sigma B factor antagonist